MMMMMVIVIITTTTWLVTLPPGNQFELRAALLEYSFCFLALVASIGFSLSLFLFFVGQWLFLFCSVQLSSTREQCSQFGARWRPICCRFCFCLGAGTLMAITSEWRPLPYNIALLLCSILSAFFLFWVPWAPPTTDHQPTPNRETYKPREPVTQREREREKERKKGKKAGNQSVCGRFGRRKLFPVSAVVTRKSTKSKSQRPPPIWQLHFGHYLPFCCC